MIRRDYILRMIEEFAQALAQIRSLKSGRHLTEASGGLDTEFKKLTGERAKEIACLSESDLLARIMRDGPTHLLRDKTFMLTALLNEAGDLATAQDRVAEGRECYLKALHLLLEVLSRGDVFEWPEFVPRVEWLVGVLQGAELPARTHAMLMQHYERTGEFARAEDELFAMLDADPDNDRIVEFGIAFYQRLLAQNGAALTAGGLPRAEVEEGLKVLEDRRSHKLL